MEVDVEPVDEIDDLEVTVPEGINAPEYVLYGGKGGVGKTTMAAATGLASARDGTATLVVSTDPAHSLSDTFETAIPPEPTRIREDIPLFAAEIDPEAAMGDGLFAGAQEERGDDETHTASQQEPFDGDAVDGMGGAENLFGGDGEEMPFADMLGGDGLGSMAGSMPGADEAAAIQLLLELFDDPRFDRVVVDTAPTGHTLRLLELPEVLDSMVGKMLTMRERIGNLIAGLRGEDTDGEVAQLREFAERIERLREVLRDPAQTDFRVVMVPEELSVLESERLIAQLTESRIPVSTIVVNRVMQDPAELIDVEEGEFVAPSHTDCPFCEHRWSVQQRALARSQDIFRGHDVKRVPLFAEEVRGERLLSVVAACLGE